MNGTDKPSDLVSNNDTFNEKNSVTIEDDKQNQNVAVNAPDVREINIPKSNENTNINKDSPQKVVVHEDGQIQETNLSTLDETVCETIIRDLKRILYKLEHVLLPRFSASKAKELQNWDLWGPLIICLLLCLSISIGNSKTSSSTSFICIFVIVWVGGLIITFNAQFLNARIGICQSICLLGYCVFPILLASLINRAVKNKLAQVIILFVAVFWSCLSSVGFISTLTTPDKKFIITFPVFLFFISLSMFVLNA